MSGINLNLLPLKLLLFFLYGALGCVAPFLTLHMFSIGLTLEEVTWINTALPLVILVGPPIAGYFADRFGRYKLITILSMLLAAIFYTSLLFVPSRVPMGNGSHPISLICNSEGSQLVFPSCPHGCPALTDINTQLRISKCRSECDISTDCSILRKPLKTTRKNLKVGNEVGISSIPPTLCFGKTDSTNCRVFNSAAQMNVSTSFGDPLTELFSSECCEYNIQNTTTKTALDSTLICKDVDPCRVICEVEIKDYGANTLSQYGCDVATSENSKTTFWVYFFLRVLADIFPAILISLLDAVALTMISQHGGDFGRQKLLGLLAIGTTAPIVGYLMDKQVGVYGEYIYSPVFYVFDFLMILTALLTFMLPMKVDIPRSSMLKNLRQLIRTMELNLLFLVVVSLGMMWAFLETFLYPHLQHLNASNLLMGLTITVGIFPSIPFLYKSDRVVEICGHHYLLILAFISYSIRFTGLSFMVNPWWVMPLEALELFTLNLVLVASATLSYKLAPKRLVCTAQGLVWMSHFNIGRCIGTLVGGYLMDVYGIIWVFKAGSVFSAIVAAIYLFLHTLFKRKLQQKNRAAIEEQKSNGNLANGSTHYVPLQSDSQGAL